MKHACLKRSTFVLTMGYEEMLSEEAPLSDTTKINRNAGAFRSGGPRRRRKKLFVTNGKQGNLRYEMRYDTAYN